MRFSEAAGITRVTEDDWFDPVLEQDSPLYIDPYLIFQDDDPAWTGAYDEVVSYFETATEIVLASGGSKDTPAWRKATRFLSFPEPTEFALGVSLGSPCGAGTGPVFADRIAEVLSLLGVDRASQLAGIAGFALFCNGIGPDRIADIIGNILKQRFLSYTKSVLERHRVATTEILVRNASWNADRARWTAEEWNLFPNPATATGVLLVPRRFLKDIPRVESDKFWDWAGWAETTVLRDDLNYDLSISLTKSEKVREARRLALAQPDIALRYVDYVRPDKPDPYDSEKDPAGLIGWYESGLTLQKQIPNDSVSYELPASPEAFGEWVYGLAKDFQHAIEHTDAWRLLWNDKFTVHRPEKIAQAIANVMWRTHCKLFGIDLSKETDVGRGPVDFKFSHGWQRRALIEMKYIESSHFSQGAEKQLPQYLKGEQIEEGVYLAIALKDTDLRPARTAQIQETCKTIGNQMGCRIRLLIVDGRPKKSASRL